jgi:hypothetical protein
MAGGRITTRLVLPKSRQDSILAALHQRLIQYEKESKWVIFSPDEITWPFGADPVDLESEIKEQGLTDVTTYRTTKGKAIIDHLLREVVTRTRIPFESKEEKATPAESLPDLVNRVQGMLKDKQRQVAASEKSSLLGEVVRDGVAISTPITMSIKAFTSFWDKGTAASFKKHPFGLIGKDSEDFLHVTNYLGLNWPEVSNASLDDIIELIESAKKRKAAAAAGSFRL